MEGEKCRMQEFDGSRDRKINRNKKKVQGIMARKEERFKKILSTRLVPREESEDNILEIDNSRDFGQIFGRMKEEDDKYLTETCSLLRGDLCKTGKISISEDLLKIIMDWAKACRCSPLEHECLWIILNISAGNHNDTRLLIDFGILDIVKCRLNYFKDEKNYSTLDLVVSILGNIAADSYEYAQLIVEQGLVNNLESIILREEDEWVIIKTCWSLCCIVRSAFYTNESIPERWISCIIQGLYVGKQAEYIAEILWTLYEYIEQISISDKGFNRIVVLSGCGIFGLQHPAFKIIYKLILDENNLRAFLLMQDAITYVEKGLLSKNLLIRKDALLISSWVLAMQCDSTFNTQIINNIIDLLNYENYQNQLNILKSLSYVFTYTIEPPNLSKELIPNLCILLGTKDATILLEGLSLLKLIFGLNSMSIEAASDNPILTDRKESFISYQGLDILEDLSHNPDPSIQLHSNTLLEECFSKYYSNSSCHLILESA